MNKTQIKKLRKLFNLWVKMILKLHISLCLLMRESIITGVEFTGYRMIKDYNEKFYSKNSELTESK